jgi:DNA modification methylase
MEIGKIYNEPCLETLKRMSNNSIDCVITSPPYWQLRDYGYPEQWGLEPTYQGYLEHLWEMMDEIYRVLKPEGTCWINLGDTYGTQSGGLRGKNTFDPKNPNATLNVIEQPKTIHKCLLLLPHRFAIGCIDRGWIMRNDCIWAKVNGMPESVTDRFSKKHEYFFFMVKSEKYYFDLDSIRDAHSIGSKQRAMRGNSEKNKYAKDEYMPEGVHANTMSQPRKFKGYENMDEKILNGDTTLHSKGKNPGDVADFWDVTTKGSSNKHYASYNDELIKKPILAGCPEGGIIYDPFMGTGSTADAALRANRQFIGSEMSKEYCDIANKRIVLQLTQPKLF